MINTSVHSYNNALKLFREVRELWDNLENASDYKFIDALDKIENLQKYINKIDLIDLETYLKKQGKLDKLKDVEHNVNLIKEAIHVIGREILGWSYHNDLKEAVPRYVFALQKKYPTKYKEDSEELTKKFVGEKKDFEELQEAIPEKFFPV